MKNNVKIDVSAQNNTSQSFDKINRDFEKLRKQHRQTNKQIKDIKSFTHQKLAVDKLNSSIDTDLKQLSILRKSFKQTEAPTQKQSLAIARLSGKIDKSKLTLETKNQALDSYSRRLKSAGIDVNNLSKEQFRLANSADKSAEKLDKQRKALSKAKTGGVVNGGLGGGGLRSKAMAATAAVGIPTLLYNKTIGASSLNEKSFAAVAKALGGMPAELKESLRQWSLKKATTASGGGLSSSEINDILASAARSGVKDIAKLKEFTSSAIKMATAFDMSALNAGSNLLAWRVGMNLDAKKSNQTAGMVNYLANNTGAEARDVSEVLRRQGATGINAGFKPSDVAAMAASMLSGKIAPEIVATSVKNISKNLNLGYAASDKQKKAFNRIGLSSETVASRMQVNAVETMKDVLSRIKRLDADQRTAVTVKIFGTESLNGVTSLMSNSDYFTRAINLSRDNAKHIPSIEKEFAVKVDLMSTWADRVSNSLERLAVTSGDMWLDSAKSGASHFADRVNSGSDTVKVVSDFKAELIKASELKSAPKPEGVGVLNYQPNVVINAPQGADIKEIETMISDVLDKDKGNFNGVFL